MDDGLSAYAIAWLVIAVSAVAGGALLAHVLRPLGKPLLRALLVSMAITFFAVPAPVPGFAEQLAPAFVVCIFEFFFQIDGSPQVSLRILGVALSLAGLLTCLGWFLLSRYRARG